MLDLTTYFLAENPEAIEQVCVHLCMHVFTCVYSGEVKNEVSGKNMPFKMMLTIRVMIQETALLYDLTGQKL